MSYKSIKIEYKDKIAIIKMIRGDKLNPLDVLAGKEIMASLDEIEKNKGIRVLVITGEGRAFSAGGDVKGMLGSIENKNPGRFMDELTDVLYKIAYRLRSYHLPVIAAVNGHAAGAGMNLALSCDMIIASDNALFTQSFSRLGLIPGFGGTYLLGRQLPWQKAVEIAFLAERITALEMHDLGFVNRVVPVEEFEGAVSEIAERLANGPTLSYARTKQLFLRGMDNGFKMHLKEERKVQVESACTRDYETGVRALSEKSSPEFKGE